MDERIAWNLFTMTGSVQDYIRFKAISREEKNIQEENSSEIDLIDKSAGSCIRQVIRKDKGEGVDRIW